MIVVIRPRLQLTARKGPKFNNGAQKAGGVSRPERASLKTRPAQSVVGPASSWGGAERTEQCDFHVSGAAALLQMRSASRYWLEQQAAPHTASHTYALLYAHWLENARTHTHTDTDNSVCALRR